MIAVTISMRPARAESDPLAELARLIGQTDPFANHGPRQSDAAAACGRAIHDHHTTLPRIPKPRMIRPRSAALDAAGRARRKPRSRTIRVRPCIRCSVMRPSMPRRNRTIRKPSFADDDQEPIRRAMTMRCTASRSQTRSSASPIGLLRTIPTAIMTAMVTAPEEPAQKRRGGIATVVAVLALAVVGTGGAFAYRTYVGTPRNGEPPIIKADTSPTKIVPAPPRQRQGAGPPGGQATAPKRSSRAKKRRSMSTPAPESGAAHGVSAAEPERQSAFAGERCTRQRRHAERRQWHAAEQPATQDQDLFGSRRPA